MLCSDYSCLWQGVFVEVDSITPRYTLPRCTIYEVELESNTFTCAGFEQYDILVSPLIPPFSYKYQCSSLLLSAYIPVYFYISAFEIFFLFLFIGCLMLKKDWYIRKLSEMGKMGILWPHFWSRWSSESAGDNAEHIARPELLLNTVKIATNDIVCYGAIQLTFGLTSPVLTMAVLLSFCLKLSTWMMVVGRFLYHRINDNVSSSCSSSRVSSDDEAQPRRCTIEDTTAGTGTGTGRGVSEERAAELDSDNALVALAATHLHIPRVFVSCFWPIAGSSSCFVAALCWDMAADQAGTAGGALWAPLTALSVPVLLRIGDIALTKRLTTTDKKASNSDCKGSDTGGDIEVVATSLNPMGAVIGDE
jgi:hypothetical protein